MNTVVENKSSESKQKLMIPRGSNKELKQHYDTIMKHFLNKGNHPSNPNDTSPVSIKNVDGKLKCTHCGKTLVQFQSEKKDWNNMSENDIRHASETRMEHIRIYGFPPCLLCNNKTGYVIMPDRTIKCNDCKSIVKK
jgi:ribosomal protein S27E